MDRDNYNAIKEDYAFDASIFSEDEGKVARIKWIIDNRLSDIDRKILLRYVDCMSYRKMGKKMNISHMTIRKHIVRIREVILKEYYKEAE